MKKRKSRAQTAPPPAVAGGKARGIIASVAVVSLALMLALAASAAFQPQLKQGGGFGWDGTVYGPMAAQFAAGEPVRGQMPFIRRVAGPWLAAQVAQATAKNGDVASKDILRGFKIVNLTMAAATALLLAAWLAFRLRHWPLAALLGSLYVWHWIAPARFAMFYPAYVDPLLHFSIIAALWAMEWAKRSGYSYLSILAMSAVAAFGAAAREAGLIASIAPLFCGNPAGVVFAARPGQKMRAFARAIPARLWLPLATGVAVFLSAPSDGVPVQVVDAEGNVVRQTSGGLDYFVQHVMAHAMEKQVGGLLVACFYAFGPILAVSLFYWRNVRDALIADERLAAVAFMILALCLLGGDNTRTLHWMTPVFLLTLGLAAEKNLAVFLRAPVLVAFLLILQLISFRAFWPIPNYPSDFPKVMPILFTPWTDEFPFFDLYTHFEGGLTTHAIALAQYLAVTVAVCFWLWRREKSAASKTSA